MVRVQLTKNFYLDEYIPKALYEKFSSKPHILTGLIDKRLVLADQALRDKFGPVTINSWWNGGDRNWSGLRTPESPQYSATSQHTFGRASDKIFRDVTAEEVRKYIRDNWKTLGITCIEDNVSWVHSDIRFILNQKDLLIVKP
ncbi:MAG: hypothetical protein ABIJ16_00740 [Bacteroidota bacterium]